MYANPVLLIGLAVLFNLILLLVVIWAVRWMLLQDLRKYRAMQAGAMHTVSRAVAPRLAQLRELKAQGLLSAEEHDAKRKDILDSL